MDHQAALAVPVLAAAAVVAVLAAGTTLVGGPTVTARPSRSPSPSPSASPSPSDAPDPADAGVARNYVVEVHITVGDARNWVEERHDFANDRERSDCYGPTGKLTSSSSVDHSAYVDVNYPDRTYQQSRVDLDPASGSGPGAMPGHPQPSWVTGSKFNPETFKHALDSGELQRIGEKTSGGHHLVHLRGSSSGPLASATDFWVDDQTFLPYEIDSVSDPGISDPPQLKMSQKLTWLPRTRENLAKCVLTPPPGFTRIGTSPPPAPPHS